MRRALGITVIVVILLLLAGEFFLPWVVARGVEVGLARTLGEGADLEVSLASRPALRMLIGRVDQLTVTSERTKTATLAIDSIAVTVNEIGVNLQDILGRRLSVSRSASIGTVIRISEGNLRRYVLDNVAGLDEPQVKILDGRAAVAGYMSFAGTPILVAAEGRFVADGEQRVVYVVDGLSIDGERVPDRLAQTLTTALGGNELFIDMAGFPLPLAVKEVKTEAGWLIIEAGSPVR